MIASGLIAAFLSLATLNDRPSVDSLIDASSGRQVKLSLVMRGSSMLVQSLPDFLHKMVALSSCQRAVP